MEKRTLLCVNHEGKSLRLVKLCTHTLTLIITSVQELRKLYTLYDQQVSAQDELNICKIRFRLRLADEPVKEIQKKRNILKNLEYEIENQYEFINVLDYVKVRLIYSGLQTELKLERKPNRTGPFTCTLNHRNESKVNFSAVCSLGYIKNYSTYTKYVCIYFSVGLQL